jgi:hypothetical protein
LTKILEALRQCGRDWFIEGWGNNDQAPLGALDQLNKAGVRRYGKSSLKIDHACFIPRPSLYLRRSCPCSRIIMGP